MSISTLILAAALQTGSVNSSAIPPVPDDLRAVPVAEFRRKPEYSYKESLEAKKLTDGCTPTEKLFDGENYFVQVLLLVDGKRSLRQVTPISIQCPALEEYVARYFARIGKNNMQSTPDKKPAWRRSVLKFYW
ncbi:hypothetical protein [Sphingorhabdus sp. 109]|jgi:hypothetical protein|uniref:hypothetical protein n=1 Tax=Sphingorhabdus sp. 109 TaxID=2653173 RepID=UPI0012EEF6EC|nr:hypothetical protein [Sphingorhabdus sp. 109]VWX61139.1 conserved hypothetical protein [Sphingorhabdus sp. 109]